MCFEPDYGDGDVAGRFTWTDKAVLPGYVVQGVARRVDGTLTLASLAVLPLTGNDLGITADILRRVPLGSIRADLRAWVVHYALTERARPHFDVTQLPTGAKSKVTALPADRRVGRKPLEDEMLKQTAVVYLDELRRGRGVNQRVFTRLKKELGKASAPRTLSTCKSWIRAAQREGWLAGLEHGRPGADPGPRLIETSGPRAAKPTKRALPND